MNKQKQMQGRKHFYSNSISISIRSSIFNQISPFFPFSLDIALLNQQLEIHSEGNNTEILLILPNKKRQKCYIS